MTTWINRDTTTQSPLILSNSDPSVGPQSCHEKSV